MSFFTRAGRTAALAMLAAVAAGSIGEAEARPIASGTGDCAVVHVLAVGREAGSARGTAFMARVANLGDRAMSADFSTTFISNSMGRSMTFPAEGRYLRANDETVVSVVSGISDDFRFETIRVTGCRPL